MLTFDLILKIPPPLQIFGEFTYENRFGEGSLFFEYAIVLLLLEINFTLEICEIWRSSHSQNLVITIFL